MEKKKFFFRNSAYLVLNNRIVAMFIALVIMYYQGESIKNQAPILKCSAISISNTIATFCQYEALKYVSFPTQTLGKCGKMIPVMILGMVVSHKVYVWKDFLVAALVTIGCATFVLTGEIGYKNQQTDDFYGLFLMAGYLFSDGFTSTFQERLFRMHDMSTYNQMLYVNLCSAIASLCTLLISDELFASIDFSLNHLDFFLNSLLLSASAAFGQLIILLTIKEFGALFFATVMTLRQIVSIVISCLIYLHPLTLSQWLSAAVVFIVLWWKDSTRAPRSHTPVKEPESRENIQVVVKH